MILKGFSKGENCITPLDLRMWFASLGLPPFAGFFICLNFVMEDERSRFWLFGSLESSSISKHKREPVEAVD